ncbi:hypothetical protein PA598K_06700 [Paenibacillus sp. 598K]|uniref:DUF2304 domain-containing protein n=1 Tax=Paenibacillus sp. 598K TaxID=1117987 RepID=UPI000FF9E52A|nr:DUF2304 domain-containing protein [Paenibacillus sp. 598K]GBF78095.1 hypothetical protein PA598K_06700 [Paenibacillus sp. 598K]
MKADLFVLSFVISAGFLAVILYLIRSRKLREQYALLWLALSLVMMVLSLFPQLLDLLADKLGVDYAPSLLYLLGLMSVLCIMLHLTIALSALTRRIIVLTQALALQEQRCDGLEAQVRSQVRQS